MSSPSHIGSLFVLLLLALPAQAQERESRDVITIEARVVNGLDSPGADAAFALPTGQDLTGTGADQPGTTPGGTAQPAATPGDVSQPGTGQQPAAGTPAADAADTPAGTPGEPSAAQAPPAPSVLQVASQLMQQANNGTLNVADTTMAMTASTSRTQNLDALVSITVIGPDGKQVTKESKTVTTPTSVFGSVVGRDTDVPAVGEAGSLIARAPQESGQVLRRNTGVYYFYVSVCACSL